MTCAPAGSGHRDSDLLDADPVGTTRIDHLIRDRCARDSTRVAIVDDTGAATTFGDLVATADTVADNLRSRGVRPGDLVCVEIARGPDLIAVLLGVLVTGAHYCALDPAWPRMRVRDAVAHLDPVVHVVDPMHDDPEATNSVPPQIRPADLLTPVAAPHDPVPTFGRDTSTAAAAAVFYTSGSSGRPKAVVCGHGAIARLVDDPRIPMGSRMLQTAPCSWDAFAFEVWIPLMSGTAVQIHARGPLDVGVLRRAVADGVDTVFLTTTVFNAFVAEDPDILAGVDVVYTGGERARGDLVVAAANRNPGTRFIHAYGPAENTIFSTVHHVSGDSDRTALPIGTAVCGTQFAVLGPDLRPVTPGTSGQIVLYGTGLALGYRNDDTLTAGAFGRFGDDDRRGYLTGDLGHLDPEGELVFDGRVDRQLKVRGVRVEPGEVERVIEQLDAIVTAAVVLPEPDRLTAFVCTGCDGTPEPVRLMESVVEHVASRLPPAFVPVDVVAIPAVPRTVTGKRDVNELIELARVRRGAALDAPVPESFAEFADLLPSGLSGDDDIFAAGATSLTAIQVAARLTRNRGGAIAVADIIAARTPDAIAALTATAPPEHRPGTGVSYTPSTTRWMSGIPLPQWRFWFSEVKNPGNGDGIDPFVFRLTGHLDAAALSVAFDDVVGRHDALRTHLVRHGDRGVRAEVAGPESAVDLMDVRPVSTVDEAHPDVEDIITAPFDLAVDLPIRALVHTTTGTDHLLAVVTHHTAFDGWSARIFFDDLSVAYRHRVRGDVPPRRESTSYRDVWAAQDRAGLADESDLAAWGRELLGVPDLPLLAPGSVASSATTSELWVDIPDSVRAGLARGSVIAATTPNAILLAAWVRALRAVTATDDFAIGIPVSGRSSAAAATTIGCFVNAVAARFRAEPGGGPRADLDQAVRALGKALRFQILPIEQLMRIDGDRPRHRIPFCQAGFVSQDDASVAVSLDGVTASFRHRVRPDSAFELTLEVWTGRTPRARIWRRDDVLDSTTIGDLRDRWLTELSAIIDDLEEAPPVSTGVTTLSDNDLRDAYLRRIGVPVAAEPSVAALTELHAAHGASVPFETLWRSGSIAVGDSLRQIVVDGRGGICYHLNGAFAWLLDQLGYRVAMHRAGTQSRLRPGPQEPNGTHVVLVVSDLPDTSNPGGRWLLDVGAGEGFVTPLPLSPGDHVQGEFRYRLRASDLDPAWWRLDYDRKESCRGVDFSEETVTADDLSELYATMAETEMAIFFTYGWVKRHTSAGYDELIGCQLARVGGNGRTTRTITGQADYFDTLSEVFGLDLPRLDGRGRADLWSRVQASWRAESFEEKWTAAR